MKRNILNIVAFCILMEDNGGIINKSPDYILEKFERYCEGEDNAWMWGLDAKNFNKLIDWDYKWQSRDLDKEGEVGVMGD